MVRKSLALLAALLLLVAAFADSARAADEAPSGNWKITILQGDKDEAAWLVNLVSRDGKWTGKVIATAEGVPPTSLEELTASGDVLRFTLKFGGDVLNFEWKMPKDGSRVIHGSVGQEGRLAPAQLEATALKSFDRYEVSKELLAKAGSDPKVFNAALELISLAEEKKAKPEEVKGWADKAFRTAESYGTRWQREVARRVASTLNQQEGFGTLALEYARRAERLLDPKESAESQLRVLNVLEAALQKGGKPDEVKEIQARMNKLETRADQEYIARTALKVDPFKGRKAKSDRAVLVELFTGAQCPPCVAADVAFDGLINTYKPADVVLLQYHLHIPGPDALANPATEARGQYYEKQVEGTPALLFNGEAHGEGGGPAGAGKQLYEVYRSVTDQFLEKPAGAKLRATAVRKGNKIDIAAEVSGVENPGENVRLRLALVEEQVSYPGPNGVRVHHHVVRDMPGGSAGFAVKEPTSKQTAAVDLDQLRKDLAGYLDKFARENPFPTKARPLEFKNLRVVAFIQNDKTKEVLQVNQVEISGEK